VNPKKKVRVELEGLDSVTCAKIGGKEKDNKCVLEVEGEEVERSEGAEGESEQGEE
jgi:hypothetical protein